MFLHKWKDDKVGHNTATVSSLHVHVLLQLLHLYMSPLFLHLVSNGAPLTCTGCQAPLACCPAGCIAPPHWPSCPPNNQPTLSYQPAASTTAPTTPATTTNR